MRNLTLVLLVLLGVTSCAQDERTQVRAESPIKSQNAASSTSDFRMFRPAQVKWQDGPPSLPRGAQFVVLKGIPPKRGTSPCG